MRCAAWVGGVALAAALSAPAMAGAIPSGPFWAQLTGFPADAVGAGTVSTDGYYTGPLQFTVLTGQGGTLTANTFDAFCVDLDHNVTGGGQYEFIEMPLTQNGAGSQISATVSNQVGVLAAEYENGSGVRSRRGAGGHRGSALSWRQPAILE